MGKVRGFVPPEPPPAAAAAAPAVPSAADRPVRYVSTGNMAARFALTPGAFGNLLRRYRNHPVTPSPVEDAVTVSEDEEDSDGKKVLGWLEEREVEIGAWLAQLPGTGSAPRSGRWRDEAPPVPEGLEWVALTGSRGTTDHVLTGDRAETLCGIKVKGTSGELHGKRCQTCGHVAAREAA